VKNWGTISWLRELLVVWRPLSSEVKKRVSEFKAFRRLEYVGRRVHGQGANCWRSFHYSVRSTDWKVVLHDQEGAPPWVLFINESRRFSWEGRYADFGRLFAQLPGHLQSDFIGKESLFPGA
jgi:hypothetical protein